MAKQDEIAERDARIAAVLPLLSPQEKAEHADEIAQFEQRQRAKALTAGKPGTTHSAQEEPMADDTLKQIDQARGIVPGNSRTTDENIVRLYAGQDQLDQHGLDALRTSLFHHPEKSLTDKVHKQDQQILDIAAEDADKRLKVGRNLFCTEDPKTLAADMNLDERRDALSIVDRADKVPFTNHHRWLWGTQDSTFSRFLDARIRAEQKDNAVMEGVYDMALRGVRDERCKAEGFTNPGVNVNIDHVNIDESTNTTINVTAPRPHPHPHHTSTAPVKPTLPPEICKNFQGTCNVNLGTGNSIKVEHVDNPSETKQAPAAVVATTTTPETHR